MRPKVSPRWLQKYIRLLREEFPTLLPVVVERRNFSKAPHDWGECRVAQRRGKRVLLITIAKWLSPEAQFQVLAHEWAHAAVWRPNRQEDARQCSHDAEFGVKWAEIWACIGEE